MTKHIRFAPWGMALTIALLGSAASTVEAATTTVLHTTHSNEVNLVNVTPADSGAGFIIKPDNAIVQNTVANVAAGGKSILGKLYGDASGDYSATLARVDDADDQLWGYTDLPLGGVYQVEVKYAGNPSNVFGAINLDTNQFIEIADANTNGFLNLAGNFNPGTTGNPFAFAIQGQTAGGTEIATFSSIQTDNASNRDHMVTWKVLNPDPNVATWVIAFEDQGWDQDYNDLVVQVSYVAPVPEPGTLALAAIALPLLGVGYLRRRRSQA